MLAEHISALAENVSAHAFEVSANAFKFSPQQKKGLGGFNLPRHIAVFELLHQQTTF